MPNPTHRWIGVLLASASLSMTTIACGQEPTAASDARAGDTTGTIETAAENWSKSGILNYSIEYSVRHLNGLGGAASPDVDVAAVVVDGEYTTCIKEFVNEGTVAECSEDPFFTMQPLPVELLYRFARAGAPHATVTFDETLHLVPIRIEVDDPSLIDDELVITVRSFVMDT